MSYSKIAEIVGVTRQRISQICLKHSIIRRPESVKSENWEQSWQEMREQNVGQ